LCSGDQGRGAGVVTAAVMGGQAPPRRCDPGEVWPPSGWSPVRVLCPPCGRPSNRSRGRPVSTRPVSMLPVSRRPVPSRCPDGTGLWCPRLCSRAVRTALDPGMARCGGPSPLGAMAFDVPPWSAGGAVDCPHRTCREGMMLGWPWVAPTRVDTRPGPPHRTRTGCGAAWPTRELVQRQGAGRLAGEHENTQVLTSPPQVRPGQVAGVVPDHGLDREVVTTLRDRWAGDGPGRQFRRDHPVRPGSRRRPQRGRST
jgi:hypothetical protein